MAIEGGPILVELYRHNTWANLRLLGVCQGLSDEQLDFRIEGTYGEETGQIQESG